MSPMLGQKGFTYQIKRYFILVTSFVCLQKFYRVSLVLQWHYNSQSIVEGNNAKKWHDVFMIQLAMGDCLQSRFLGR